MGRRAHAKLAHFVFIFTASDIDSVATAVGLAQDCRVLFMQLYIKDAAWNKFSA
jgi:hypothetical protein